MTNHFICDFCRIRVARRALDTGVAAMNNHTVELPDGTPITLHDALGAWALGEPIDAIDEEPSAVSECPQTTSAQ